MHTLLHSNLTDPSPTLPPAFAMLCVVFFSSICHYAISDVGVLRSVRNSLFFPLPTKHMIALNITFKKVSLKVDWIFVIGRHIEWMSESAVILERTDIKIPSTSIIPHICELNNKYCEVLESWQHGNVKWSRAEICFYFLYHRFGLFDVSIRPPSRWKRKCGRLRCRAWEVGVNWQSPWPWLKFALDTLIFSTCVSSFSASSTLSTSKGGHLPLIAPSYLLRLD